MPDACARESGPSLGRQAVRYGIVGVVNTGIGYLVILGLHAQGASLVLANLGGYAAGLAVSYLGNRAWTFGASRTVGAELPLYLAVVAGCFVLNLGAVRLLLAAGLPFAAAQAVGVFTYSTIMFMGLRHVVFAARR